MPDTTSPSADWKTAVARYVEKSARDGVEVSLADVAASFQEAVADVLTMKAIRACTDLDVDTLVLGGGPRPIHGSACSPKSVAPQ